MYEGRFLLSSDVGSAVVSVKDEVGDPAGEDRERTVRFAFARGYWRGYVGNARDDGGQVDLRLGVGTPRLSL